MKTDKPESKVRAIDIKRALAFRHCKEFFVTECKNGPSYGPGLLIFDALAIDKSWAHPCTTIYEIKVSRSDFLRDVKYCEYAKYCNRLYIAAPAGMIKKEELPLEIGLIEFHHKSKALRIKKRATYRNVPVDPDLLMYIFMSKLENDRIPFYSDQKEFLEAWVEEKRINNELGKKVGTKMAKEITALACEKDRLEHEIETMKRREKDNEDIFNEITQIVYSDENVGYQGRRRWNLINKLKDIVQEKKGSCPLGIKEIADLSNRLSGEIEKIKSRYGMES